MEKDWTGNKKSVYSVLGSSHHSEHEREVNDYYATEPRALELLLTLENFKTHIWECACGEGHLSIPLIDAGFIVKSTDIVDRGFKPGFHVVDFLEDSTIWEGDIITNPPYKFAKEFIFKCMDIIPEGSKIAMFLKVQFLESKGRKELYDRYPPKTVWVSRGRLNCAFNGNFTGLRSSGGSAAAYAWYIWEKGYTGGGNVKVV